MSSPYIKSFGDLFTGQKLLSSFRDFVLQTAPKRIPFFFVNYYSLLENTTEFGQNLTTPPLQQNSLKYRVFSLQPAFGASPFFQRLSSDQEELPALKAESQEVRLYIPGGVYTPKPGDLLAFDYSLNSLAKGESSYVFRVTGVERDMRLPEVFWKLTVNAEKMVVSEGQLKPFVTESFCYIPQIDVYIKGEYCLEAVRILEELAALEDPSFILNPGTLGFVVANFYGVVTPWTELGVLPFFNPPEETGLPCLNGSLPDNNGNTLCLAAVDTLLSFVSTSCPAAFIPFLRAKPQLRTLKGKGIVVLNKQAEQVMAPYGATVIFELPSLENLSDLIEGETAPAFTDALNLIPDLTPLGIESPEEVKEELARYLFKALAILWLKNKAASPV